MICPAFIRSNFAQQHHGRMTAIAVTFVAILVLGLVLHDRGWQKGWQIWGVSTHDVAWLDLRVISAAIQTAADHGNPYLANPHDPTGRPFNYPSLWLWIFPRNPTPVVVTSVALAFAAAAFCTMLLWMTSFTVRAGAFVGLLLISPSLLLAVERGNTDLAIFALTGSALILIDSRHGVFRQAGILGLLLASVLKLFPVIGLAIVALIGPSAVSRSAQLALAFFLAWLCLHWSETVTSLGNTQIGVIHSYGRRVLPLALELSARVHGRVFDRTPFDFLMNALAGLVAAVMSWLGYKLAPRSPLAGPITYREIGWLTGASIYALTFLAGCNFNYRLWFLLLSLAWLLPTARGNDQASRWAQIVLGSFFVLLYASAVWWIPLVWIAQVASWLLFAAITVLLVSCITSLLRRTQLKPPLIEYHFH